MRECSVQRPPRSARTRRLTDLLATERRRSTPTTSGWRPPRRRLAGRHREEFADEVTGVAKGLIAAGIEAGDRVAVMSKTRYEWTVVDFALFTVGAVVVPIYETSSAEQVEWILSDSGAHRRRSSRPTSTPRSSSPCATRRPT